MTQIRAYSGQVSVQEVNILSKRVAAAVLVPRVVRQLTETRQDVAAHRSFMEKLDAAYRQGKITEKVHATLAAEYGLGLESATARLKAWEEEVEVWRINGRPVLEEGIAWLK